MAKQLTWGDAIQQVLNEAGCPLHYSDITQRIIDGNLRSDLGATPAATVASMLSSSIKNDGLSSPYSRISRGTYGLASAGSTVLPGIVEEEDHIAPPGPGDTEPQYAVVTSFGMFWRRELVEWTKNAKILGFQPSGKEVDFCHQRGIYLLYDGREVIYVGRTTERALGLRLYEHTNDRLAVRWDRFSWFGLRPVKSDGSLDEQPSKYEGASIIPALEAILVEAVEPRQNRKRGDDLGSVEFLQKEDPEIQLKKLQSGLLKALAKK